MKKSMLFFVIVGVLIGVLLVLYSFLWIASSRLYEVKYGISFNLQHATYLGLDWKELYSQMLDDLKPEHIRISATWKEVEPVKGGYVFDDVDWQMFEAAKRHVNVVLVIGQKAPRWPECHVPDWAGGLSDQEYSQAVKTYMQKVIERYRNNPSLEVWQVENEPFLKFRFGECSLFRKDIVHSEILLVKALDPVHDIMVTDSGELSTWIKAAKAGDIFGSTIYRIVMTPRGMYWNYDWLPPAFYRFKALIFGRKYDDFWISELQAEPWFTESDPNTTSLEEQFKSMNIDRLKKNVEYSAHLGASRAYFWGVEWWYWQKQKQGDSSYWEYIKTVLEK